MGQKNRYGLSRDIPEPTKRDIRKRCGFGCVKCGFAYYQYHHFDPPFEEAKSHDPRGITLLCGRCHDLEKGGLLSQDSVRVCNKNPICLTNGFSFFPLDLGTKTPEVILGTNMFINNPIIIEGYGLPLLEIEAPEESGTPFRISAVFQNKLGKEIARIVQNEWHGVQTNWDIQINGPKIIIRHALRSIDLEINIESPNRLIIERINMFYRGWQLNSTKDELEVYYPDGSRWFTARNALFCGNSHGIVFGD
ncbi:MAG: hypothetical protein NTX42_09775 [Methanothrix sp.]|nr:hypothetical protein [Methanothrix sp.]